MARKEDPIATATATPDTSAPLPLRSSNPNGTTNSDKNKSDGDTSMTSTGESECSSDNASSSEEDEEPEPTIPTVTTRSKPNFSARIAAGAPSLEDRLKSFLPQLAEANSKLEQEGGSMEDVKDDEPHIEMNLGLGVLKEKSGKEGEESSDSEEETEEGEDAEASSPERKRKEKDVMRKLMGGKEKQAAAGGIQEVG